jgi:peptidoglycan/xylan/chitin deacetylase (PgdA/CDA1 family)
VSEGREISSKPEFWPDGARLAVTVSMMFEAGGQPITGASGPVTEPIRSGYPDLPQNSFYEYGVREGILRMLDLFDKHEIKVSSFMIGEPVKRHPELAAEIVDWDLPGGPFVTVPYTVHMDDVASFDFTDFSPTEYVQQLDDEFEQLYEEGATRRRMMSLSLHDRISGHASRVRALDRFLAGARQRPDVWWARRDQIADWALATPEITPTVERGPAEESGLSGRSGEPLTAATSGPRL